MSDPIEERLYGLIPDIYRFRDGRDQQGELRALLGIIDREVFAIDGDISGLYENWFIETCDEWAVPYIADLLAVQGLIPVSQQVFSQRAFVANVLGYRRRKGTAAMLEQLAQDHTGLAARAVEFFRLLTQSQHLNHLRPANFGRVDLRDDASLGRLGGPFESAAHNIDVRRSSSAGGRYSIANVGLFLFRLESDPITLAEASFAEDAGGEAGFYRFDVLGSDRVLFNRRRADAGVDDLSSEASVPLPLRRRPLHDDLTRAQQFPNSTDLGYFGVAPVLTLQVDGQNLPPAALCICNLSDWARPADVVPVPGGWAPASVSVDPVLGRIAFAKNVAPVFPPLVSYQYGIVGAVGGGGYKRSAPGTPSGSPVVGGGAVLASRLADPALAYAPTVADDQRARPATLRGQVLRAPAGGMKTPVADQLEALLSVTSQGCIVEIADSLSYQLGSITVPAGQVLEVRAASGARPLITWQAGAALHLGSGAVLILDGLLLTGDTLTVADAPEGSLVLLNSTMVPGLLLDHHGKPTQAAKPSLTGPTASTRFDLLLYRCITGPLRLRGPLGSDHALYVEDSVVDDAGGGLLAIDASHGWLARTTVLGSASFESLDLASDSIFTGTVETERSQEGCVRFSFIPDGSRVSQPYRCQPAMALQQWAGTPPDQKPDRDIVLARVLPSFTSLHYGDPGYGQLTSDSADEVRRGASDEGSMGAFNFVQEPQRENNLRTSLPEYLRFGLEASIIYVT